MDVVPANVLGSDEFDQGVAAHVHRFHLPGQPRKPLEFGNRTVDLDEPICPFALQTGDLFKKRHPRVLLCSKSHRVAIGRAAILWQDSMGFKGIP